MHIKELKKEFIEAIIEERTTNGLYASLQEFLDRVKAESAQTRLLIKAGCFDSITGEVTRQMLHSPEFFLPMNRNSYVS